jgi:hypothetical protein
LRPAHATTLPVTNAVGSNGSGGSVADNGRAWESVRDSDSIQFDQIDLPETTPPDNSWLRDFFDGLGDLLEPFAQLLGISWPILSWILIGIGVALLAYILWKLLSPIARLRWEKKTTVTDDEDIEWVPERSEAIALLGDADKLAAAGCYDEATHLLLLRSVNQIVNVRPEWLDPSSTAREISRLPGLPDKARTAFTTISDRVERSLFALRRLEKDDWEAARAAYADFALADFRQGAAA